MASKILLKRGLEQNIPTLNIGELGFATDTGRLFVGTSDGNRLVTNGTEETEEILTYTSGKLTKVESDVLKTELFYDGNGKVNKVQETYKVDNLKYETTFTFNVDGLINKITKELI